MKFFYFFCYAPFVLIQKGPKKSRPTASDPPHGSSKGLSDQLAGCLRSEGKRFTSFRAAP